MQLIFKVSVPQSQIPKQILITGPGKSGKTTIFNFLLQNQKQQPEFEILKQKLDENRNNNNKICQNKLQIAGEKKTIADNQYENMDNQSFQVCYIFDCCLLQQIKIIDSNNLQIFQNQRLKLNSIQKFDGIIYVFDQQQYIKNEIMVLNENHYQIPVMFVYNKCDQKLLFENQSDFEKQSVIKLKNNCQFISTCSLLLDNEQLQFAFTTFCESVVNNRKNISKTITKIQTGEVIFSAAK